MSGLIGTSHSKSKVIGRSQDTAIAWVNLNGTGTIAIRDSYNVSSIADNNNGDYTISFMTPIGNANYSLAGSASFVSDSHSYTSILGTYTMASASCRVRTTYSGQSSGGSYDSYWTTVIVFGT